MLIGIFDQLLMFRMVARVGEVREQEKYLEARRGEDGRLVCRGGRGGEDRARGLGLDGQGDQFITVVPYFI